MRLISCCRCCCCSRCLVRRWWHTQQQLNMKMIAQTNQNPTVSEGSTQSCYGASGTLTKWKKKVLTWLFASYRKIRMFYCTSLQGILHKMPAANTNTGDHILPTSGSDKVKHSHACILFACMCCIMNFMAQYQFNRHWQVQSCSYLLEKSTTDL